MLAVAFGHWLAMVVVSDDGELVTGNVLEFRPGLSWLSWLLQVMPLFFFVGGFASAASLVSFEGRPQDWIAARLRRMLAPAVVLAATWVVAIVVATLAGVGGLALAGFGAAAIPLWFLSNYVIDLVAAPFLFPAFQRSPKKVTAALLGAFATAEALNLAGVPLLPHINWIIGWLGFQVAGFAWYLGYLPSPRRLFCLAVAAGAAAVALVTFGPYAVTMVHFDGVVGLSPTHPPTLALIAYGTATSFAAAALAPRVTAFLERNRTAWTAVIAANGVAMSVYLWHMTAAVIVMAIAEATGLVPEVAPGSTGYWVTKVPMLAASVVVLAGIVKLVVKTEQAALLAPKQPWHGGITSMVAVAAVMSALVKVWVSAGGGVDVAAAAALVAMWTLTLRAPKQAQVSAAA